MPVIKPAGAMTLDQSYSDERETRALTLWLLTLALGLALAVLLTQAATGPEPPADTGRSSTERQLDRGIAEGARHRSP